MQCQDTVKDSLSARPSPNEISNAQVDLQGDPTCIRTPVGVLLRRPELRNAWMRARVK